MPDGNCYAFVLSSYILLPNTQIMKSITLISALLCLTASVSFRKPLSTAETVSFGICDCTAKGNPDFRLTIHPDSTFTYFSNMDPRNVVNIKGTWSINRNSFVLSGYDSKKAIHSKWKLEKNGSCITSRKGMEFSRLCRIQPCD